MYGIKVWISLSVSESGVEPDSRWYDLNAGSYYIYSVRGGKISVDNEKNIVSHEEFKETLMVRILIKEYRSDERSSIKGHDKGGRFEKGNRCSEKLHISDEELYLLYKVCGNQAVVAERLGVCRQTVWRRIKRFEPKLDWFKRVYGGRKSVTSEEAARHDPVDKKLSREEDDTPENCNVRFIEDSHEDELPFGW